MQYTSCFDALPDAMPCPSLRRPTSCTIELFTHSLRSGLRTAELVQKWGVFLSLLLGSHVALPLSLRQARHSWFCPVTVTWMSELIESSIHLGIPKVGWQRIALGLGQNRVRAFEPRSFPWNWQSYVWVGVQLWILCLINLCAVFKLMAHDWVCTWMSHHVVHAI